MLYDIDDNPLSSAFLTIPRNGVRFIQMKVDCRTGLSLLCEPVDNLLVEAKHSASGVYINLETASILLTPWANTRQTFDFRLTASNVTNTENFGIYTE